MMFTIHRVSRLSSVPHLGMISVTSARSIRTAHLLYASSSMSRQQLFKPTTCITQYRQLSYFKRPGPTDKDISEQTADIPKGVTIVFKNYLDRNTELQHKDILKSKWFSFLLPSDLYYMTYIYYNIENEVFSFRAINRLAEVKVVDVTSTSDKFQTEKIINGFSFQGNHYSLGPDEKSTKFNVLDKVLYTKFLDRINGKDSKNTIDNGVSKYMGLDKESYERQHRMQNNWNKLKAKKM